MTAPLIIPAKKRLVFQLGWDTEQNAPATRKPNFIQNLMGYVPAPQLGENNPLAVNPDGSYDLDLCCFVFDGNKTLIDAIRPGMGHDVNDNESIFHSGDDETGRAGEFDEELSIDLATLPAEVQTILLYIRVDDEVEIDENSHVKFRILNATDGVTLLNDTISFEQQKEKGCVLGRLSRTGDQWTYIPVTQYLFDHPDGQEQSVFAAYL